MSKVLTIGGVAYDPKVVTIWEGFRQWLRQRDFDIDFVLYSNYERQVEELAAGNIDLAWNSPLAWVRTRRVLEAAGKEPIALFMRDTDQDLRSAIVVRADSDIQTVDDLKGKKVGVGAVDSPQATLLPLSALRAAGLTPGEDFEVVRFDIGVGLHGDHTGGERDAAAALAAGNVDAACMTDRNLLRFSQEGTLVGNNVRVLAQTDLYDHCVMAASPKTDRALLDEAAKRFEEMSYGDASVRPLLDLEGLKQWVPGRTEGFGPLERAVDETGFYDAEGNVIAAEYRP